MKMFNVLPTDPRFKELTEEHIEFISIMLNNDYENIKEEGYKKSTSEEKYIDPDFDEYWDSYAPEEEDIADIDDWRED